MMSLNNIRFCSVKNCLNDIVNPDKIEALNIGDAVIMTGKVNYYLAHS